MTLLSYFERFTLKLRGNPGRHLVPPAVRKHCLAPVVTDPGTVTTQVIGTIRSQALRHIAMGAVHRLDVGGPVLGTGLR